MKSEFVSSVCSETLSSRSTRIEHMHFIDPTLGNDSVATAKTIQQKNKPCSNDKKEWSESPVCTARLQTTARCAKAAMSRVFIIISHVATALSVFAASDGHEAFEGLRAEECGCRATRLGNQDGNFNSKNKIESLSLAQFGSPKVGTLCLN